MPKRPRQPIEEEELSEASDLEIVKERDESDPDEYQGMKTI